MTTRSAVDERATRMWPGGPSTVVRRTGTVGCSASASPRRSSSRAAARFSCVPAPSCADQLQARTASSAHPRASAERKAKCTPRPALVGSPAPSRTRRCRPRQGGVVAADHDHRAVRAGGDTQIARHQGSGVVGLVQQGIAPYGTLGRRGDDVLGSGRPVRAASSTARSTARRLGSDPSTPTTRGSVSGLISLTAFPHPTVASVGGPQEGRVGPRGRTYGRMRLGRSALPCSRQLVAFGSGEAALFLSSMG